MAWLTRDDRSDHDKDSAGELLDQKTRHDSLDKEKSNRFSRLPPKTLPLRTTTQVVRALFWTGALAVVLIIALGLCFRLVEAFEPDVSPYIESASLDESCDLATQKINSSAIQSAFIINLRANAHLTFSQAKAIDVIWQLFVGAGGRFLLAWISYKVFMDGLTRLAEESAVSYDLHAHLTFSTTSLWAIHQAIKGIFIMKGWRSKLFLFWFSLSTIYVLGFQTLMSATAGYVSPSTAGYNMTDGTFLTPDSPNLQNCYSVSNGAKINLTDGVVAVGPPVSYFDGYSQRPLSLSVAKDKVPNFMSAYPLYASLLNATSVGDWAVYDITNTTSLPTDGTYYPNDYNFTVSYVIEGKVYRLHNDRLGIDPAYCYQNQTISGNLADYAECLPTKYFVWGFSSLMVNINLYLLIIWIFGMYLVWMDANIYSALCRSGRKVRGPFRAVADLSEAMGEVLGNEHCAYSDSELAYELKFEPGLKYYASDPCDGDVSHIGLSSRRLGRVPYNSTKLYGKNE